MLKDFLKRLVPWIDASEKILKLHNKSNNAYINGKKKLAEYYAYKILKKYRSYISPSAEIGKNIIFPHPIGIVIGEGVKIGDNCVIYQHVTIGRKEKEIAEYPIIGNNVIIYCNSTLIGKVSIGDNSIIGCNSVVLKSVEEGTRCVGVVK